MTGIFSIFGKNYRWHIRN